MSQSISNFDYVGFYYQLGTSDTQTNECIYKIENVREFSTDAPHYCGSLNGKTSASGNKSRRIEYVSDTQLKFYSATSVGASGDNNSYLIPTKIVGLK